MKRAIAALIIVVSLCGAQFQLTPADHKAMSRAVFNPVDGVKPSQAQRAIVNRLVKTMQAADGIHRLEAFGLKQVVIDPAEAAHVEQKERAELKRLREKYPVAVIGTAIAFNAG